MADGYYRTGQAAKQLGVSSYHVRRLCEAGEIVAEITGGRQWKIPLAEVRRLQKEGVPPVPQQIAEGGDEDDEARPGYADESENEDEPAAEVKAAANAVKIAGSHLERRRLERETEEVEDWFRERGRREEERERAELERAETARAAEQRREWINGWIQYALNSMPPGVPRETELDVNTAVEQVLANFQYCQSEITIRRLVIAAVEKVLAPWRREQQRRDAVEAAMNQLPLGVRFRPEFAPLKLHAIEAASAAVARCRAGAISEEMEIAAKQAIQPMIREHSHQEACQRLLGWINLPGATGEEIGRAKVAVQKALSSLPVGASQKKLEEAKQTALEGFRAKIARREEAQRAEAEQRRMRSDAEWKADVHLRHVEQYLNTEYEFDDGSFAMREEARRLRGIIREMLIEELMEGPEMSSEAIEERIEELIDDGL